MIGSKKSVFPKTRKMMNQNADTNGVSFEKMAKIYGTAKGRTDGRTADGHENHGGPQDSTKRQILSITRVIIWHF